MKKILFVLVMLLAIPGVGLAGGLIFTVFGAEQCNEARMLDAAGNVIQQYGSCDCFCCHGFGVAGYESCGIFGFLLSCVLGLLTEVILIVLFRKKLAILLK